MKLFAAVVRGFIDWLLGPDSHSVEPMSRQFTLEVSEGDTAFVTTSDHLSHEQMQMIQESFDAAVVDGKRIFILSGMKDVSVYVLKKQKPHQEI